MVIDASYTFKDVIYLSRNKSFLMQWKVCVYLFLFFFFDEIRNFGYFEFQKIERVLN